MRKKRVIDDDSDDSDDGGSMKPQPASQPHVHTSPYFSQSPTQDSVEEVQKKFKSDREAIGVEKMPTTPVTKRKREDPKASTEDEFVTVGNIDAISMEDDEELDKIDMHSQSQSQFQSQSRVGASQASSGGGFMTNTPIQADVHRISSIGTPKAARTPKKAGSSAPTTPATSGTPAKTPPSKKLKIYMGGASEIPPNLHSKPLPVGKTGCLEGLSFIVTGVLDSTPRDEAHELIVRYGGIMKSGVSGKLSYLVVGENAGESKLAKAKAIKEKALQKKATGKGKAATTEPQYPKIISEDDLFEMISSSLPAGAVAEPPPPAPKSQFAGAALPPSVALALAAAKAKGANASASASTTPRSATTTTVQPATTATTHADPMAPAPKDAPKEKEKEKKKRSDNFSTSPTSNVMWVDKYKPMESGQIAGQNANIKHLKTWLKDWEKNRPSGSGGGSGSKAKPKGGNLNLAAPAVLLNGPPGVGKSTTARVVASELGYNIREFNASDDRSRKLIQSAVKEVTQSSSISDFFTKAKDKGKGKETSKTVLIMDEIDGMDGNADRGGLAEIMAIIKKSRIPIICICNDRRSTKMRSFSGSDSIMILEFKRAGQLQMNSVVDRVTHIATEEGLSIEPAAIRQLVAETQGDLRQCITLLQLWRQKQDVVDFDDVKSRMSVQRKNLTKGPFDILKELIGEHSLRPKTIGGRLDLYFNNYDLIPLFVQENYLRACIDNDVENMMDVSSAISQSDTVSRLIMSQKNFSLLPLHGALSTVIPSVKCKGKVSWPIEFPKTLGQLSHLNARKRLLQDIHFHAWSRLPGVTSSDFGSAIPLLRQCVVQPLSSGDIDSAMDAMGAYGLVRADLDSMADLTTVGSKPAAGSDGVESKVKAQFTRQMAKHHMPLVSVKDSASLKRKKASDSGVGLGGTSLADDDDADEKTNTGDGDDLTSNPMIKQKIKRSKGKGKGKGPAK